MRDADDQLQAPRARPLALGPDALAGVLATAARLSLRHDEGGAAEAVAAELMRATGIDATTLARAQADRLLEGALTGLSPLDRRLFALKTFVAALPGSLLPRGRSDPQAARVRAHVLAKQAGELRAAGARRRALWLAHRAIWLDRTCCKAWVELGRTLEHFKRLEAASDAYRQAIEVGLADQVQLDPQVLSTALNNLALLIEGAVPDEVAEAMYLKALEVRPSGGIAAYNLALLYKNRGRLAEAEAMFTRGQALRPDDPDVAKELKAVRAAREGA